MACSTAARFCSAFTRSLARLEMYSRFGWRGKNMLPLAMPDGRLFSRGRQRLVATSPRRLAQLATDWSERFNRAAMSLRGMVCQWSRRNLVSWAGQVTRSTANA